jgi:hypothetical protein
MFGIAGHHLVQARPGGQRPLSDRRDVDVDAGQSGEPGQERLRGRSEGGGRQVVGDLRPQAERLDPGGSGGRLDRRLGASRNLEGGGEEVEAVEPPPAPIEDESITPSAEEETTNEA